jgi:hypothetical protein
MEFNSLDAQREACAAYILSQKHEGWTALPDRYDDGGFSGGSTDRPALQALLDEQLHTDWPALLDGFVRRANPVEANALDRSPTMKTLDCVLMYEDRHPAYGHLPPNAPKGAC